MPLSNLQLGYVDKLISSAPKVGTAVNGQPAEYVDPKTGQPTTAWNSHVHGLWGRVGQVLQAPVGIVESVVEGIGSTIGSQVAGQSLGASMGGGARLAGGQIGGIVTGKETHSFQEAFSDPLATEGLPEWSRKPVGAALGLTADIALDPTTYLGVGMLTKTGKVAQEMGSVTRAAERIATTTDELTKAERAMSAIGVQSKLARDARAAVAAGQSIELGKTAAQQVKLGQRASLGFGFVGKEKIWTSKTVNNAFEASKAQFAETLKSAAQRAWDATAGKTVAGAKVGGGLKKAVVYAQEKLKAGFSTKTGNEEVDTVEAIARNKQEYLVQQSNKMAEEAQKVYNSLPVEGQNRIATVLQGVLSEAKLTKEELAVFKQVDTYRQTLTAWRQHALVDPVEITNWLPRVQKKEERMMSFMTEDSRPSMVHGESQSNMPARKLDTLTPKVNASGTAKEGVQDLTKFNKVTDARGNVTYTRKTPVSLQLTNAPKYEPTPEEFTQFDTMLTQAGGTRQQFLTDIRGVAQDSGTTFPEDLQPFALKSGESAKDKLIRKRGEMPTDLLRYTVVSPTPEQAMPNVIAALEQRGYHVLTDMTDNLFATEGAGYKHIALKFTKEGDTSGIIHELQIIQPNMQMAKSGLGHMAYDINKSIELIRADYGTNAIVDKAEAALKRVSAKLYDEAYKLDNPTKAEPTFYRGTKQASSSLADTLNSGKATFATESEKSAKGYAAARGGRKGVVHDFNYPYKPVLKPKNIDQVLSAMKKYHPEVFKDTRWTDDIGMSVFEANTDAIALQYVNQGFSTELSDTIRKMGLDGVITRGGEAGTEYVLAAPKPGFQLTPTEDFLRASTLRPNSTNALSSSSSIGVPFFSKSDIKSVNDLLAIARAPASAKSSTLETLVKRLESIGADTGVIDNSNLASAGADVNRLPSATDVYTRSTAPIETVEGKQGVNDWIREQNKTLAPNEQIPLFETNPVVALQRRGMGIARAVSAKEYVAGMKRFGKLAQDAPDNWLAVDLKGLDGMRFEPEVAKHIDAVYQAWKPEELGVFMRMFRPVQDLWKAQALLSPAYHTRNFVSNKWNNFLAGVNDAEVYKIAFDVQRGKEIAPIMDGAGHVWTSEEIIDAALKNGVINEGWYAKDIGTNVEKTMTQSLLNKTLNPLNRENVLFKMNRNAGSAIENNDRLAHFIYKLREGNSAFDASQSVKKYLFDYGELTPFEQKTMKSLFPFYTWTRKNIPLQLEALATQPGKFAGTYKVQNAVEANAGPAPDERFLSSYIKDNVPVRIRTNKDGSTEYFLLGSWLPSAQMLDFLSQSQDSFIGMMTPFIKVPLETLFNKSLFFKTQTGDLQDIESTPGESKNFLGLAVRGKVANLLRNIRLLNIIDQTNPAGIFGDQKRSALVQFPAFKAPLGIGEVAPTQQQQGLQSPEPSALQKITSVFAGKTASYSPKVAAPFYRNEQQRAITDKTSTMKKELKKGNRKRADLIRQEIIQLRKKMATGG